jgi:SAM-dependent methyltransferase
VGGFKDHFSGVANDYAVFRPDYPGELFAWIASVAPSCERAWDCATGNGQAAVLLKHHFRKVLATDASAEQIASARPHRGIQYAVASAERSGLANNSVDAITVAQAAHWFDLPSFYEEARRVLSNRGLLAIWCYGHFRFGNDALDQLVNHFYHDVVGPYWPPERRFIEQDYRAISFPLNEIAAPATFHMQAQFSLPRLAGYLRTWSATQHFLRAEGYDPVTELETELARYWPAEDSTRTLPLQSWPIHIRVGYFK